MSGRALASTNALRCWQASSSMRCTPVTSSSKNPAATGLPRTRCRMFVCLVFFYCEFHWVDRRRVCTLFVINIGGKKVFEGKDLEFQLLGDSNVFHWCHKNNYRKHFPERSLWIFPHKDFITLTRLSWAKIINNKTNRVRRWHQLFVSDQYATSNPNTTCPKANTRASRIFNAVRNMCCAEHVDACLPVLVMEKTLFSCREDTEFWRIETRTGL